MDKKTEALKLALEEQSVKHKQVPVACMVETEQGVLLWPIEDINEAGTYCEKNEFPVLLYTSPPAKPWVSLTDEDIGAACGFGEHTTASTRFTLMTISRAIEAKLKEKNND